MADNRVTLTASMRSNLLSLQATQKMMDVTQNRLSTGLKVNSALDNPSSFFTAQSLNTRANELESLLDGMGQAIQTIKTADESVTSMKKLVDQAKALANNARDTSNVSSTIKSEINFEPLGAPTEIGGVNAAETFSVRLGEAGEIKGTKHMSLTQTMSNMGQVGTGVLAVKVADNSYVRIQIVSDDTIEAVTKKINDNTRLKGLVTASVVDGKFTLKTSDAKNSVTVQALDTAGLALAGGDADNSVTALGLDAGYTVTMKTAGTATIAGDAIPNAANASGFMSGTNTMTTLGISPTPAKIRVMVGENLTDITLDATETLANLVTKLEGIDGINAAGTQFDNATGVLTVVGEAGKAIKVSDITGNVAKTLGAQTTEYIKPTTGGMDAFLEDLNSLSSDITASIDKNGNIQIKSSNGDSLVVSDTVNGAGTLGTSSSSLGLAGLGDNGTNVRKDYAKQFNTILDQIDNMVQNSDTGYKGVNLLKGDNLTVNFNESRTSTLEIKGAVLDTEGLGLNEAKNEWKDTKDIDRALADIDTASSRLEVKASEWGQNLNIIQTREDFTDNMVNILTDGANNLTLADMNEEAANMLSLQTRQQLGTNALSLASQSQQSVLKLF
ncbi:MAG: flagellin [Alphaproteobacteria bacterium ADurb.Bin438]|nr:MAG: flagellin [Alphaproteobacteria bacterium ADurb.Bin438]